jgi:HD-GYP domain-containing protein (c-di-GMP phosphodiesterase class II)
MGDEIHDWAKIAAVADIWDALRSDRPYKKGWPPDKVLTLLNSDEMKTKLDAEALRVMNQVVVPYTLGTQVKLSTGEVAVVVELNKSNPLRPTVRTIKTSDGRELNGDGDIHPLQKEVGLLITETLVPA